MASLIRADDLGADVEDHAVKEGRYDLRIIKADYGPTKKGDTNQLAVLIAIEREDAPPIRHYLGEPGGADDPNNRRKIRDLKRFLTIFGVPFDKGFDMDEQASDLVGCTASNAMVTTEDYEGTTQNRLRLPRID